MTTNEIPPAYGVIVDDREERFAKQKAENAKRDEKLKQTIQSCIAALERALASLEARRL